VGLAHGSDKVVHFLVYGLLGFLWVRALLPTGVQVGGGGGPVRRAALLAALLAAGWGVLDEIHQSFVPGRDASPADAVADTLGGAAGAVLAANRFRARARTTEGHHA